MTQIEKDIAEIKTSLAEIKKVLGIGMTSPAKVVDITQRAKLDAARIKERLNKISP